MTSIKVNYSGAGFFFIGALTAAIFFGALTIWNRSVDETMRNGCSDESMIGAMEQYGRIGIIYLTPIFDNTPRTSYWSATFNSRHATIQIELKAYGETMCDSVAALYDKWYEIPFERIKSGEREE